MAEKFCLQTTAGEWSEAAQCCLVGDTLHGFRRLMPFIPCESPLCPNSRMEATHHLPLPSPITGAKPGLALLRLGTSLAVCPQVCYLTSLSHHL